MHSSDERVSGDPFNGGVTFSVAVLLKSLLGAESLCKHLQHMMQASATHNVELFLCYISNRESLCELVQYMIATFSLLSVCTDKEGLGKLKPFSGRLFLSADQRSST